MRDPPLPRATASAARPGRTPRIDGARSARTDAAAASPGSVTVGRGGVSGAARAPAGAAARAARRTRARARRRGTATTVGGAARGGRSARVRAQRRARPRRPQQRGGGSVALLAVLVPQAGEHAKHGGRADRVAPLERAPWVVEPQHHARVDVPGRADALPEREGGLV